MAPASKSDDKGDKESGDKNDAGWAREHLPIVLVAALAVVTVLLYTAVYQVASRDTLSVTFLDVGQGDAALIEAPNGAQLLIDGGRGARVIRELGGAMPFWDRSIEVVLATHPDSDHIGGLVDVLRRYSVAALVRSGVASESGVDDALLGAAGAARVDVRELRAGDTLRLSPRVHFDILFPPVDPSGMDPNDASLVGRLVYGDTSFLFSGDAPKAVEEYLADIYTENLRSDVLKVGHHGSDTSTALAWIGWSSPEYAVISAGEDNSYGHPHADVVERLERFGIKVLETAKEGAITFESNGERVRLVR
ncbi:MAG: ComEC/Rec2 family competence protein [Candidatus Paceibacterota bacterium]